MTALGLVVAVPAVLAYNWLIRRNKSIMEDLAAFTNDLHGYLVSGGKVKPVMAGVATTGGRGTTAARPTTAPPVRGSEPVRAGDTRTGADVTPTGADRP
jgi:biopolymer transport protein ExbB